MRIFIDCRSRGNSPRFTGEFDAEDQDIQLALLRAEETVDDVIGLPSIDGMRVVPYRVFEVAQCEGGKVVTLVRATPLH